jgi:hypothetical protein
LLTTLMLTQLTFRRNVSAVNIEGYMP